MVVSDMGDIVFELTTHLVQNIQNVNVVETDINLITKLLHDNNVTFKHWAGQLLHLEKVCLSPYNKIARDTIKDIIQRYYEARVFFTKYGE